MPLTAHAGPCHAVPLPRRVRGAAGRAPRRTRRDAADARSCDGAGRRQLVVSIHLMSQIRSFRCCSYSCGEQSCGARPAGETMLTQHGCSAITTLGSQEMWLPMFEALVKKVADRLHLVTPREGMKRTDIKQVHQQPVLCCMCDSRRVPSVTLFRDARARCVSTREVRGLLYSTGENRCLPGAYACVCRVLIIVGALFEHLVVHSTVSCVRLCPHTTWCAEHELRPDSFSQTEIQVLTCWLRPPSGEQRRMLGRTEMPSVHLRSAEHRRGLLGTQTPW